MWELTPAGPRVIAVPDDGRRVPGDGGRQEVADVLAQHGAEDLRRYHARIGEAILHEDEALHAEVAADGERPGDDEQPAEDAARISRGVRLYLDGREIGERGGVRSIG